MSTNEENYLRRELYERVCLDTVIFDFLQESTLDGIWYWGIEQPENQWVSPQLKRDLGFSDDEAPDSASWWSARMDPEDRERAAVGLERHREDPAQPYDEILRYRHKNGSIVWVRCRGIIIRDDANRPIRMLGAHTDVTALKAIETELGGHNTELSSQNEELQDFTALVTHELRAPLRGFLALMHELDEDNSEVLDDDTRELIAMAIERVERLQRSVNGLLDYARFGGNTASKTSVALDQIVLECLDELNVRHAATVEFDADLPPLRADREWMIRLFRELLANSIDHHDGKKELRIAVRGHYEKNRLDVRISDNGPGIPEKHSIEILDIFRTLENKRKTTSSGVGLTIVKKIVDSLNGNISIGQELDGRGVTFLLRLPLKVIC